MYFSSGFPVFGVHSVCQDFLRRVFRAGFIVFWLAWHKCILSGSS